MIYLLNTNEAQQMMVPKNRAASGPLTFSAQSSINLSSFEREVIDVGFSSLYFMLSLTIEEGIPAGEYEYSLTDEAGLLSSGVLIVGDLSIPVEYTNEVTYEQYETI